VSAALAAALGALPYIQVPDLHLGPIPIRPFGALVGTGILVGAWLAGLRAKRLGLDADRFSALALLTILSGLVLSHVADTLAYRPEVVWRRPWELLLVHEGLSSFGGFFGAVVGFLGYGRGRIQLWKAADAIGFGLPFAWLFGRAGCAVVHDHPGVLSTSALAVAFPGGSRFDLGLLELLLTPLLVGVVLLAPRLWRWPGSTIAAVSVGYALVRFPLDFLRAPPEQGGDVRYLGLTPGHYAAAALFALGFYLFRRSARAARAEAEAAASRGGKQGKRAR
jgi:phosphatidylglycerol---prolipoprotein diacylglyceryl transferase